MIKCKKKHANKNALRELLRNKKKLIKFSRKNNIKRIK